MSTYDEEAWGWQTSDTRKPPLIFSPKGMVRLQMTRVSSGRVSFNSIKNFCRFSLYVSIQPEYLQKPKRIQTHILSYMSGGCLLVELNYIWLDSGLLRNLQDSPWNIPQAGVDNDYIWFQATTEVFEDALHVVRVDARHKVEADQVVVGPKLPNLSVLRSIVHLT